MQLKIPVVAADETMQLRVLEPGVLDGRGEESKPGGRGRRKAPRPSVRARFLAVVGASLAPFVPFFRRLRPRYPRPGRTDWRRWLPSWRQWLGIVGAAFGMSTMFLTIAYATTEIPEDLNTFATQQDNVYFWSDGTPMARTGWVRRQAMPLKDVPEDVRWAVLAAENASFYSDPGISVSGITRALVRTVGEGDTQGGSTITQQYVKNVYLSQDRSLGRKFDEAMIALKLDNKMSKDKILEAYLNTSWFGRGTYGIQRAAQSYYGKDVGELNVSEAAFLASLLKGAGLYDPALSKTNRERAEERWEWILDRMVSLGKLSRSERAAYNTFPEPLNQGTSFDTGKQTDYLVVLAAQYAKKAAGVSDQEFDMGGFQIYTTFDRERQDELTKAVTKARARVKKAAPKKADAAHFGASSVAADGRILAVYGGPDHRRQGFNESNATTVPSGSAFLPFVYAAALEHGVVKERGGEATPVTPQTVYDGNDNIAVTTPEGPYWDRGGDKVRSHNDGNKSWGQITLHDALTNSVNTPFMQLGMDTGLSTVRDTAEAAGLLSSSLGAQVPALSVGSATPSAIRMASGYSTFAALGKHTEPYSVRKITHNGSKVALNTPKPKRAVGGEVARQVTEALTDAFRTDHPTSPGAASFEVAGKGGTTQDDKAAWYVGTAEDVSTAVVVYRIDLTKSLEPLPLDGIAGTPNSGVPYDIWSSAMSIG
ncbi:transglycosylase domain-containing protein [Streptomyces capitiformicae]|uniref:Penicillin-binding protein n=1 Tax=Streptomyces capitiformicae TaxID=2014920 RepID=A0A919DBP1_9ACTN|nr:transglycosylase domain-containing protein [Streptomyces capitiformicae]GHE28681.1 penicillin-binding protein [Streptomyces capitiformicae]